MTQKDNWGSAARIGMFIVGSEAVPEAEWYAMAPPHASVHAARVTAKAPWAQWNTERSAVTLEPDVTRGAEQFASMRLTAVVIGHSSSSFAGGKGWDEAVIGDLSKILAADTHVTTNGLDCLAALSAAGIHKPLLVLPAWFGDGIADAGMRYFNEHACEPVAALRYDPGPKWRDVPPGELYPRGMGFEQEIDPLFDQIIAACPPSADGIMIAGTGFRCVAIIDKLERQLGIPVITANQASLWCSLRLSGVDAKVPGYGRLLAEH
jgi:maleate isomerase